MRPFKAILEASSNFCCTSHFCEPAEGIGQRYDSRRGATKGRRWISLLTLASHFGAPPTAGYALSATTTQALCRKSMESICPLLCGWNASQECRRLLRISDVVYTGPAHSFPFLGKSDPSALLWLFFCFSDIASSIPRLFNNDLSSLCILPHSFRKPVGTILTID
jgi:hypothetical protein